MAYLTLISPEELISHHTNEDWAVIDCRFSLTDTSLGRSEYMDAHIPGAIYAHLDEDLSSEIIPGVTGRHPLPDAVVFARRLGEWGISDGVQVIAYDQLGGAIAARLWWMLRQLGHQEVAVLDGGWQAWKQGGYPVRSGEEHGPSRTFPARAWPSGLVTTEMVMAQLRRPATRLIDVRAPERYRGELEPIDPVAGHIPGAISAPYADNLDKSGHFLPADVLRERYEQLLADVEPEDAVFYCGSGVTSNHSLLAMAHAGLAVPRLYVGSWSEWIADKERPIATGSAP